jgi:hypothetical protein
MTGLHIAPGCDLPVDAVTETFGILAKKGAGKSNAAVVMAEEMHAAGVPWVAVDPKGDWWGLRSSADGQGAGLPIVVFGGRHADVPLEPTGGALIADLVLEHGLTCVLDVSEFNHADVRRFLLAFAERLYRQSDADPLHLFLEEAHEYLPQMVRGEDAKLVGAWQRIVKQGRFKGLGCTLISQRSAALNKDVLTQVDTLIVLRTTSPQDRAAVKAWVDVHAEASDMLATLPSLESGEAWLWSPEFLGELKRIRFRRRSTFDSGATPKVGQERRTPATLADVDLAAIKEQMAETIKKAKADDPKELRARVRQLEKELAEVRGTTSAPEVQLVHVPVVTAEVLSDFRAGSSELVALLTGIREELERVHDLPEAVNQGEPTTRSSAPRATSTSSTPGRAPGAGSVTSQKNPPPAREMRPAADGGPSKPQHKILNSLAWFETVNITAPTRGQVAFQARVSPKSSGFDKNCSTLRTRGLIDYPAGNRLALTDDGRSIAEWPERPGTSLDLQQAFYEGVSDPQAAILRALVDLYPDDIDRQSLADAVGVSAASSGFDKNLSTLRSLELVDYPQRGFVVATRQLFLEERS